MVGDLDPYESASGSYSVREIPAEDVPKSLFGRPYLRGQYQRSPYTNPLRKTRRARPQDIDIHRPLPLKVSQGFDHWLQDETQRIERYGIDIGVSFFRALIGSDWLDSDVSTCMNLFFINF